MSRLKRFLRSPDHPERRVHRRAAASVRLPSTPRRCDHCGVLLAKDFGDWRVAVIDGVVQLVCSIQCGEEMEATATLFACLDATLSRTTPLVLGSIAGETVTWAQPGEVPLG